MNSKTGGAPQRSATVIKKRTVAALVLFVFASAVLHFTLGPAMTALTPHWASDGGSDQGLSIVTLSRRAQIEAMPKPMRTPTPPPQHPPLTDRTVTLLKDRELASDTKAHRTVHVPARRISTIILERRVAARPHEEQPDAGVVMAAPEPTPGATQAAGLARASTSGGGDQLVGAVVWGDDNPPRLIKRAAVSASGTPAALVRVAVDVGPDGSVLAVRIVQSSGDAAFDRAALDAARASTFAPATLNGMPVHGSCTLEFAPGAQAAI